MTIPSLSSAYINRLSQSDDIHGVVVHHAIFLRLIPLLRLINQCRSLQSSSLHNIPIFLDQLATSAEIADKTIFPFLSIINTVLDAESSAVCEGQDPCEVRVGHQDVDTALFVYV